MLQEQREQVRGQRVRGQRVEDQRGQPKVHRVLLGPWEIDFFSIKGLLSPLIQTMGPFPGSFYSFRSFCFKSLEIDFSIKLKGLLIPGVLVNRPV